MVLSLPPTNPAANRLPRRAVEENPNAPSAAERWRLRRAGLLHRAKSEYGMRAAGAGGLRAQCRPSLGVRPPTDGFAFNSGV